MLSVKQVFNGNTVLNDLTITETFSCSNFVFVKANNLSANEGYEIAASLMIKLVCNETIGGVPIKTDYGEKEIPLEINFVDTEELLIIPEEVVKQGFECYLIFATSYQINITVYAAQYQNTCCEELKTKLDEIKSTVENVGNNGSNIIGDAISGIINSITAIGDTVSSVTDTVNEIEGGLNDAIDEVNESIKTLESLIPSLPTTGSNNCCEEVKTRLDELKITVDGVNTNLDNLDNTLPSFAELNELYNLLGLSNANNPPTTNLPVVVGLPVLAQISGAAGTATLPIIYFIPGML